MLTLHKFSALDSFTLQTFFNYCRHRREKCEEYYFNLTEIGEIYVAVPRKHWINDMVDKI